MTLDGGWGRLVWALSAAGTLTGLGGCGIGIVPGPGPGTAIDGNRDPGVVSPLGKTSGEPNDTFANAIAAVFDSAGVARLQGTISIKGDMDVFLLGALSPGDRVIVDAETGESLLDASVAIFDSAERIVVNNDDRSETPVLNLDPYVDWIVRHAAERYYLVVSHSAFSSSGRFTGTYSVDVEVSSGLEEPEPVGQLLMLDFDGGVVASPALQGPVTLAPFDAGAISALYLGQTPALKEAIRSTMEQNYERFEVAVITTDDPPPPEGMLYSTVYFGGYKREAFGIAESVDLYNADFCDDAIIYTESFVPSIFTTAPTVAQLGVAIGNIAAHEAGHLLGLNHVSDNRALMDDRSAADAFLEDQEFMEAPLSSDIIPIGKQDAVLLLEETVGVVPF